MVKIVNNKTLTSFSVLAGNQHAACHIYEKPSYDGTVPVPASTISGLSIVRRGA